MISYEQGFENMERMWLCVTRDDLHDGLQGYRRYHNIMRALSDEYGIARDRVVAVFVSLSPNTDYINNLRSTKSVLHGVAQGWPPERIQVSTYRHCLLRAYAYATGQASFLEQTKGPKIRAFYHNVLDPNDQRYVTVDGHMVCIWRGLNLTMRQALVRGREYSAIQHATKALAFKHQLVPCEAQAVLWHARKRMQGIKYDRQHNFWPADEPTMLTGYRPRLVGPEQLAAACAAPPVQDLR